jgi:adenine-specific DNA-methyltransferase
VNGQTSHPWAQQLGLVATPLFGREKADARQQHLALLDGIRASFLLSDTDDEVSDAADWAWSANVRHHVLLKQRQIVVSRATGSKETLERQSVESKLMEFLRYLELDADAQKIAGVIDHIIRLFRRHRASLRERRINVPDIDSFLYLLAITQEDHQGHDIFQKYSLTNFDADALGRDYISRFIEEVQLSSVSMRRLITPLTIRHAGGALFQEAHAEIISAPIQMTLFGLADVARQRLNLSTFGIFYTPPGLARILTEIAIEPHLKRDSISINDPACGSGIFLCEAIRVLQRRKYAGKVELIGRDVSSSAVQMARFSIACALLDWPDHQVKWSVDSGDFFEALKSNKRFTVVLMNPPFISWDALTNEQRGFVRDILGSAFAGKPDLSTAFIQESLKRLTAEGTLATLIPRGVLDSQRGRKWRDALLSKNDVRLLGTFGEHGLFRHAMVSIAAAVFERKRTDAAAVMVWADERPNSAESALRALRRRLFAGNQIEDRSANWSIYSIRCDDLAVRKSWLPTPNALGSLLDYIKDRQLPSVQQLFSVRQGIKTGLKEAFLISNEELKQLPTSEQRYFRRVASGDDIVGGRVRSSTYIFFAPNQFKSEPEMLRAIPKFGQRLLKYKSELRKRTYVDPKRWWEVFRPKKDLAARSPRILTKMFGALNMAAVDAKGEFLPLQAFAWMPTPMALGVDADLKEAALWWYCRILNSRVFFLLRREFAAATTSGGQLDVSRKYIDDVPLPVPTRDDLIAIISAGEPDVMTSKKNDELVAAAYGTNLASWPIYAAD